MLSGPIMRWGIQKLNPRRRIPGEGIHTFCKRKRSLAPENHEQSLWPSFKPGLTHTLTSIDCLVWSMHWVKDIRTITSHLTLTATSRRNCSHGNVRDQFKWWSPWPQQSQQKAHLPATMSVGRSGCWNYRENNKAWCVASSTSTCYPICALARNGKFPLSVGRNDFPCQRKSRNIGNNTQGDKRAPVQAVPRP